MKPNDGSFSTVLFPTLSRGTTVCNKCLLEMKVVIKVINKYRFIIISAEKKE